MPEVMFVWGNNPIVANSDGFFGHWVIDLMKRGMKTVVIDPRVTWLGVEGRVAPAHPPRHRRRAGPGHAERHHQRGPLRPRVRRPVVLRLRRAGRARAGIPRWTRSPRSRGCPAEKIVAAARLLAESKPATLQWGLAIDMTREAIPAGQAIAALFQITGNIDVPGRLWCLPLEIMAYSGGWGRDLLRPRNRSRSASGLDRYRLLQMGFKQSSPDVLIETLETGEPYEIHGALLPDHQRHRLHGRRRPERVYNAFNKCDFIDVGGPVHDAHDHGAGRPGHAGRHVPRAQRHPRGRRPAARRDHQQGARRSANASPTWRSTWNWASA